MAEQNNQNTQTNLVVPFNDFLKNTIQKNYTIQGDSVLALSPTGLSSSVNDDFIKEMEKTVKVTLNNELNDGALDLNAGYNGEYITKNVGGVEVKVPKDENYKPPETI